MWHWFIDWLTISRSCIICAPSVDISTNTRLTYRSITIYWLKSDPHVSFDIDWHIGYIGRSSVGRYVGWLCLSDCQPNCWAIGYWHSANTSLILEYLVDCSLCCRRNLTLRLETSVEEQRRYPCSTRRFSEASLYYCCTSLSKIGHDHLSSAPNKVANQDNRENVNLKGCKVDFSAMFSWMSTLSLS